MIVSMNNVVAHKAVAAYMDKSKQAGGEPVCAFIYDLRALREHAERCVRELPDGCQLFYAMKANPDEQFLKCLAPIVHGFEAASIGEIRKVRKVAPHIPVIFGGPGKKDSEIAEALDRNVTLLHAESIHELRRISMLASERDIAASILLRVNVRSVLPEATLTMAGRPTQFGIDEAELPDAIRLAQSLPNVVLEGFHLHSISNNLDARLHALLIATYWQRVKDWSRTFGLSIKYVNVGGGFGISYTDPDRQFEWPVFTHELQQVLAEHRMPGVQLLCEPGRYIAAACGYYAVEVTDIKRNHGKNFAIIRGGSHHFRLPGSWQHSHPFEIIPVEHWPYPFPRTALYDSEITVAGELCTPKDVLAREVKVDRLRIGDVLLFQFAGAYGWTISSHDFLSHAHPEHIYLEDDMD